MKKPSPTELLEEAESVHAIVAKYVESGDFILAHDYLAVYDELMDRARMSAYAPFESPERKKYDEMADRHEATYTAFRALRTRTTGWS